MARTNNSDVTTILATDLASAAVDAWIEVANEHVDEIAARDSSIDSTRLTKIEELLAAHLASTQDQRVASGARESARVTYQGETGQGITGTKYGQAAAQLDPTDYLRNLDKPRAGVHVPDARNLED